MNSDWQSAIKHHGGHIDSEYRSVFSPSRETSKPGFPSRFIIPCSEDVVLVCTGADRVEFLQNQLTCDLMHLVENRFLLGAYCNPKGRVLATLRLYSTPDSIQLVTHRSIADALLSRLRMYILRADVEICLAENVAILCVGGFANGDLRVKGKVFTCPVFDSDLLENSALLANHGTLVIGKIADLFDCWNSLTSNTVTLGSDYWSWLQIRQGVPTVTGSTSGVFTPQNINLDLIDGVSFSKGCYPGQEIVARVRYLGKVKQRMIRGRLTDPITLQPGDSVYASESGTKCGVVVCSASLQDRSTELLMSVSGFLENSNSYHAREPGGPEISRLEVPYTVSESR